MVRKKWSVLAISDEVIPPGRSRKRRNKIYVAEIRLLHRWEKHIKFFGKPIYHVLVFPNLTNDDFNDIWINSILFIVSQTQPSGQEAVCVWFFWLWEDICYKLWSEESYTSTYRREALQMSFHYGLHESFQDFGWFTETYQNTHR